MCCCNLMFNTISLLVPFFNYTSPRYMFILIFQVSKSWYIVEKLLRGACHLDETSSALLPPTALYCSPWSCRKARYISIPINEVPVNSAISTPAHSLNLFLSFRAIESIYRAFFVLVSCVVISAHVFVFTCRFVLTRLNSFSSFQVMISS